MRLTCLKCGHQMEVAASGVGNVRLNCVCGQDYSSPQVVNTGTQPSEEAAERSRSRAFRAAGLVKNVGGFSLGISLLGILFFPIALLGAGIGIYVLTMLRGPLGRYSGRRAAVMAVFIGSVVFLVEGAVAANWLKTRRVQRIVTVQNSVSEDLRALLRAQRLFRATHDTYGTFSEFRFRPPSGKYTVYLGAEDLVPAIRDDNEITDPLPMEYAPTVSETFFTAFASANLDADAFMDVWSLDDQGTITHLADDAINERKAAGPRPDFKQLDAIDPTALGTDAEAPDEGQEPAEPVAPREPKPAPALVPTPAPAPAPVPAPVPKPTPAPEPSQEDPPSLDIDSLIENADD